MVAASGALCPAVISLSRETDIGPVEKYRYKWSCLVRDVDVVEAPVTVKKSGVLPTKAGQWPKPSDRPIKPAPTTLTVQLNLILIICLSGSNHLKVAQIFSHCYNLHHSMQSAVLVDSEKIPNSRLYIRYLIVAGNWTAMPNGNQSNPWKKDIEDILHDLPILEKIRTTITDLRLNYKVRPCTCASLFKLPNTAQSYCVWDRVLSAIFSGVFRGWVFRGGIQ